MFPAVYATPAALVLTVGGLLACFAGYRLFRFVLGLYGFYLGAVITTTLLAPTTTWALILAAVVGGLVGGVLIVAAYFVGVGLIGAGLVALCLTNAWLAVAHAQPPTWVLVVACVLGALGALSVVRYVVVFGTAIAGAWTLVVGGLALTVDKALHAAKASDIWILYPLDPVQGRHWIIGLWFVIALLGVVVQLATTSKTGRRKAAVAANKKT
jgi:hypothetical protein